MMGIYIYAIKRTPMSSSRRPRPDPPSAPDYRYVHEKYKNYMKILLINYIFI